MFFMFLHFFIYTAVDDCTKDDGEEFLSRCIAFELRILSDSLGIRLKNAVHLGKKLSTAIFSAIVYCKGLAAVVKRNSRNLYNNSKDASRKSCPETKRELSPCARER